MIKEALEYLTGLARPTTTNVANRTYSVSSLGGLSPVTEPEPDGVQMHTLTGLVDYMLSEPDLGRGLMIHIRDHETVDICSNAHGPWHQRDLYAKATPMPIDQFRFGQFMELDKFMISFASKFVDTFVKADIIKYLGNIKAESVKTSEDDGISQTVQIKNSLGRLDNVLLEPIVRLAPYRTFPEIEQPESRFLFRLEQRSGSLPLVALFEADGGAWKVDAIETIRKFLFDLKASSEDPSVRSVPIIA